MKQLTLKARKTKLSKGLDQYQQMVQTSLSLDKIRYARAAVAAPLALGIGIGIVGETLKTVSLINSAIASSITSNTMFSYMLTLTGSSAQIAIDINADGNNDFLIKLYTNIAQSTVINTFPGTGGPLIPSQMNVQLSTIKQIKAYISPFTGAWAASNKIATATNKVVRTVVGAAATFIGLMPGSSFTTSPGFRKFYNTAVNATTSFTFRPLVMSTVTYNYARRLSDNSINQVSNFFTNSNSTALLVRSQFQHAKSGAVINTLSGTMTPMTTMGFLVPPQMTTYSISFPMMSIMTAAPLNRYWDASNNTLSTYMQHPDAGMLFVPTYRLVTSSSLTVFGPKAGTAADPQGWLTNNSFIGLKFDKDGGVADTFAYGWLRLGSLMRTIFTMNTTAGAQPAISFMLTASFKSFAGKSALASSNGIGVGKLQQAAPGEAGDLALLAAGAAGLMTLRKRRRQQQ